MTRESQPHDHRSSDRAARSSGATLPDRAILGPADDHRLDRIVGRLNHNLSDRSVQSAAIANEQGSAFVCDSADRCIEITRTPAGFNIAGARDTRWAGLVATVLARHGGETP